MRTSESRQHHVGRHCSSTFGTIDTAKRCMVSRSQDADSILMNIEKAWNAGRYNNKSVQLKKRVLSEYNWEQMADASGKYTKMLSNDLTPSRCQ